MSLTAVIGANYGDEGKGLLVDHLSRENTLVVRYCGGAQAGHTVQTPEGRSHVFHHIGSGTFRGASTLLSRFFIINPILFVAEYDRLNIHPSSIYVDPRCLMTTPFDMLINRAVENARGDQRHGSCGVGIHETMVRSETLNGIYRLTAGELQSSRTYLKPIVDRIVDEYVPARLKMLNLTYAQLTDMSPNTIRNNFRSYLDAFNHRTRIAYDTELLKHASDIVFEGAQGLQLDEIFGTFPHVTHARTGIHNIDFLIREAGIIAPLDVVYVTRSYLTRHGAGPLSDEVSGHPYGWVGAETNVTNDFQGPLRYAPLDLTALQTIMRRDIDCVMRQLNPMLAVTCLDQMPSRVLQYQLLDNLASVVSVPVRYASYGPTRNDIRWPALV